MREAKHGYSSPSDAFPQPCSWLRVMTEMQQAKGGPAWAYLGPPSQPTYRTTQRVAANILVFSFSFGVRLLRTGRNILWRESKAQVKSTKECLSSFHNETIASLAEQRKKNERIKYHAEYVILLAIQDQLGAALEDRLNGTAAASSKCQREKREWGNKSDKIKSQHHTAQRVQTPKPWGWGSIKCKEKAAFMPRLLMYPLRHIPLGLDQLYQRTFSNVISPSHSCTHSITVQTQTRRFFFLRREKHE